MDEEQELKALQKVARDVAQTFERLTKVRARRADTLPALEAVLASLPSKDDVTSIAHELRTKLERLVQSIRKDRREGFGTIEAEFVRRAKAEKRPIREVSDGWRIGMLEIHLRREHGQVRVLYDHEEILPWAAVSDVTDLEAVTKKAQERLERSELPEALRANTFWRAYQAIRADRERRGLSNAGAVPILDFYREVRVELVRQELAGRPPDRKLTYADLPRWAFLFNLDRYRAQDDVASDKKLALQTGSQTEQQRGMGLVTNGLNAGEDYKVYCYVVGATTGRT